MLVHHQQKKQGQMSANARRELHRASSLPEGLPSAESGSSCNPKSAICNLQEAAQPFRKNSRLFSKPMRTRSKSSPDTTQPFTSPADGRSEEHTSELPSQF